MSAGPERTELHADRRWAVALNADVIGNPGSLDAHLVLVAAREALGQHRRAAAAADLVAQRFPTLDLARFAARQPFTKPAVMERWMADLKAAGIGS